MVKSYVSHLPCQNRSAVQSRQSWTLLSLRRTSPSLYRRSCSAAKAKQPWPPVKEGNS